MFRVCALLIALSFPTTVVAQDKIDRPVDPQQELQEAIDAASAELLTPGPRREGWDKGGIDLTKVVESRPGGTARKFFHQYR